MSHSEGQSELNFLGIVEIGGSIGSNSLSQPQQSENIESMTDSMHDKKKDKNHLSVTNNDTQYVFSRVNVAKYLSALSDHGHLEGEIILPKPVDARLIKVRTLQTEMNLLSYTILIRTRNNVHVLPLRCLSKENSTTNRFRWLQDKVDQSTNRMTRSEEQWASRIQSRFKIKS